MRNVEDITMVLNTKEKFLSPGSRVIKNWFMLGVCFCRVVDACRNFGEHERNVRVAQGIAKSNSSFLSAL